MNLERLSNYLKLNTQEFRFQFQSHPAYPSALAFSDTLNFLGVKNNAYELEKEFWEELPSEFITLYQNNFALIRRFNDKVNVLVDKEEIISFKELKKNSQNFILLFEKKFYRKRCKNTSSTSTNITFPINRNFAFRKYNFMESMGFCFSSSFFDGGVYLFRNI